MSRRIAALAALALLLSLAASPAEAKTRTFHFSPGTYSTSYATLEKIVVHNRHREVRVNVVGGFDWRYVDAFELELHTPHYRRSWTLRSRTPHRLGPQKARFFKSVYRVGLVKRHCAGASIRARRNHSGAVLRIPQRCFGRHTPAKVAGSVWIGDSASNIWAHFGSVRRG